MCLVLQLLTGGAALYHWLTIDHQSTMIVLTCSHSSYEKPQKCSFKYHWLLMISISQLYLSTSI